MVTKASDEQRVKSELTRTTRQKTGANKVDELIPPFSWSTPTSVLDEAEAFHERV
ncbi:hypothetical protein RchiOBHm_Chr6g0260011 [Rosa chinensis]|uniref:Uncharacterized protein n=1 Tax=Rosa chinensis TaxID=74649 RepID=A0A2P6PN05_ROSCH|nr:hypothetical protein RchiOBHm_Chr6g0260011 [Rosa chinensis]